MQITKNVLTSMGVSSANADKHLDALNEAMAAHGIDSRLRIAHFLAQIVHESAHMKAVSENLNYSTDGLLRVFRKYFKTRALAEAYARKPQKIASRVYANRMGNGNEASGDGWTYRGRGLVQLTGKHNYGRFSQWIGEDVVSDPDRVAEDFAAHSAVFYWDVTGLNALADTDNLRLITKRVNGGLNGFADRRRLLEKAKRALADIPEGTAAPAAPLPRPVAAAASAQTKDDAPFAPTHRVVPSSLNLRKEPRVSGSTRVASLPQNTTVQVLGTADDGWVQVRALLGGRLRDGFVAERYLAELPRGGAAGEPAGAPFKPSHRVVPAALNLRSAPKVSGSTRIAALAQGAQVEQLGDAKAPGWVMVRTLLNGVLREGFVADRYLAPLPRGTSFSASASGLDEIRIPPALLPQPKDPVTRARDGGRLYPLSEPKAPKVSGTNEETRAKQLLAIIDWMDCENPEHKRYAPRGSVNRADTYAQDYCALAGAYLPRVWWTADALARIALEEHVEPAFERTVRMLNTNALHDWLIDFGADFGWHRDMDLISIQEAANAGEACLIVAKSAEANRPGSIVVVPPEHEGCMAKRDKDGDVLRPIESKCASTNRRCITARGAWWLSDRYADFGLWRNPLDPVA